MPFTRMVTIPGRALLGCGDYLGYGPEYLPGFEDRRAPVARSGGVAALNHRLKAGTPPGSIQKAEGSGRESTPEGS